MPLSKTRRPRTHGKEQTIGEKINNNDYNTNNQTNKQKIKSKFPFFSTFVNFIACPRVFALFRVLKAFVYGCSTILGQNCTRDKEATRGEGGHMSRSNGGRLSIFVDVQCPMSNVIVVTVCCCCCLVVVEFCYRPSFSRRNDCNFSSFFCYSWEDGFLWTLADNATLFFPSFCSSLSFPPALTALPTLLFHRALLLLLFFFSFVLLPTDTQCRPVKIIS